MHYVRSDQSPAPQLLQVHHAGRNWLLQLVHCTQDETRSAQGSRVPHLHDVYHIVLFTQGANQFWLGDRAISSRPGLLVLCPPGLEHDFGPRCPGHTRYDEVTFELTSGKDSLILPFSDLLSLFASEPVAPLPLSKHLSATAASRMRARKRSCCRSRTSMRRKSSTWISLTTDSRSWASVSFIGCLHPPASAAAPRALRRPTPGRSR